MRWAFPSCSSMRSSRPWSAAASRATASCGPPGSSLPSSIDAPTLRLDFQDVRGSVRGRDLPVGRRGVRPAHDRSGEPGELQPDGAPGRASSPRRAARRDRDPMQRASTELPYGPPLLALRRGLGHGDALLRGGPGVLAGQALPQRDDDHRVPPAPHDVRAQRPRADGGVRLPGAELPRRVHRASSGEPSGSTRSSLGIVFDKALLSSSHLNRDPELHATIVSHAERRVSKMKNDASYAERIRRHILEGSAPGRHDMQTVSRALGVTRARCAAGWTRRGPRSATLSTARWKRARRSVSSRTRTARSRTSRTRWASRTRTPFTARAQALDRRRPRRRRESGGDRRASSLHWAMQCACICSQMRFEMTVAPACVGCTLSLLM